VYHCIQKDEALAFLPLAVSQFRKTLAPPGPFGLWNESGSLRARSVNPTPEDWSASIDILSYRINRTTPTSGREAAEMMGAWTG
jgi:hypothetical protein